MTSQLNLKKTSLALLSILLLITVSIGMGGCKKTEDPTTNPLTLGEVKRTIVKNETSQSEVLKVFGSPNMVTRNKKDQEVWSYTRHSYDSSKSDSFASLLLIGKSKATSSQSSASFDLIITFDKKDVVVDYEVIQTKY